MTFEKKPKLKSRIIGCLNCGFTESDLKMNSKIIAGFGTAMITKNGKCIYNEPANLEWEDAPTLMKFENLARKDPDHDWQFHLILPLREAVYQRHGKNYWCLIETGRGFA